jgi:acetyltransferase
LLFSATKRYEAQIAMTGKDICADPGGFSSYPDNYQGRVCTTKGVDIFIRPLFETDLLLLKEFLHSLSARSVYLRFLAPVREFSEKILAQLIQVDHKSHIALAAFPAADPSQYMLGVARLFIESDLSAAEFSVVVLDTWQGKGIGAELFSRVLEIGRSTKVQKIWGLVLPENTQMLKLARSLNFVVRREQDSSEYFVSKDVIV